MTSTRKQKIFIGSSKEQIEYARAVQESLYSDFETKIWDQQVYQLSEYPLEALDRELDQVDFGVFVVAPDDLMISRGDKYLIPRDNVIFELGMFTGKLGRGRTFILAPIGDKDFHLPTDLLGLTVADYDPTKNASGIIATLGPACNKIRRLIKEQAQMSSGRLRGIIRVAGFTDFHDTFEKLFRTSTNITLYFIHSRQWRENHHDRIRTFLAKEGGNLVVFLPDLSITEFIKSLQTHFDDGAFIPGLIADAYRYFRGLGAEFPNSVTLKLIDTYPTYSFYKFDDTIVVAMYPTTPIRTSVPTFEVNMNSEFGDFIAKDIVQLNENCRTPNDDEILSIIKKYSKLTD